jgi:copine 1/2/3
MSHILFAAAGSRDVFLSIFKGTPDGKWIKVHETEVVRKNLDPVWNRFTISSTKLTGGAAERPLRFEVYDWDKNSAPDFIGAAEGTLELLQSRAELPLINPAKQKKRKYTNSGVLRCDSVDVEERFTFMDFLRGDTQLNLMPSIDFTGSNGNPANPTSLHHLTPYQPNEYESAIQSVGSIVGAYDTDGMFPVYGFGAKLPGQTEANHCFALNGNPANPEVPGVPGIVQWYHTAVQSVKFSGPTNFAPTIRTAVKIAEQFNTPGTLGTSYLVLLILTDGVITDADKTVRAIIEASDVPMSIIIVGVGKANFEQMDMLDADDGLLRQGNAVAKRDIVQFVPYRDFASRGPEALAAEVLRELPDQVVEFFKMKGIRPRDPPPPYRA